MDTVVTSETIERNYMMMVGDPKEKCLRWLEYNIYYMTETFGTGDPFSDRSGNLPSLCEQF